MKACWIYTPCQDETEAKKLSHLLIEKGLIACSNIQAQVTSVYRWEGKVEEASESILLCKTLPEHFEAASKVIEEHHSYDCPCILQIPIENINPPYLDWMREQVTGASPA